MSKEFKYALQKTLPVMAGYLSIGIAYGLLLQNMGYNFLWAILTSFIIYAGAMQFVMLTFLSGGFSLPTIAIMTLLFNSRHAFYGLSFIDTFKNMGKKTIYMIHTLSDETYSLLCSYKDQADLDNKKTMFFINLLDQSYWVIGSALGALIGSMITFDTTGIDFAMTALFVTIFVDQWKGAKSHVPALSGIAGGIICLFIFGADNFILPAILSAIVVLVGTRRKLEEREVHA